MKKETEDDICTYMLKDKQVPRVIWHATTVSNKLLPSKTNDTQTRTRGAGPGSVPVSHLSRCNKCGLSINVYKTRILSSRNEQTLTKYSQKK